MRSAGRGALVLAACVAAGCARTPPPGPPPTPETIAAQVNTGLDLRVTRADGRTEVFRSPYAERDTLFGQWMDGANGPARAAVAFADIRSVRTVRSKPKREERKIHDPGASARDVGFLAWLFRFLTGWIRF